MNNDGSARSASLLERQREWLEDYSFQPRIVERGKFLFGKKLLALRDHADAEPGPFLR